MIEFHEDYRWALLTMEKEELVDALIEQKESNDKYLGSILDVLPPHADKTGSVISSVALALREEHEQTKRFRSIVVQCLAYWDSDRPVFESSLIVHKAREYERDFKSLYGDKE